VGVQDPEFRKGGEGQTEAAHRRVNSGCSTNHPHGGHASRMQDDGLKGGNAGLCG